MGVGDGGFCYNLAKRDVLWTNPACGLTPINHPLIDQ